MSTLSDKALQIAASQVGVKEVPLGSNAGPQVSAYLASVGLPPGNSWCMAFQYWCFNEASNRLGVKNPMKKSGGVLNEWESEVAFHQDTPQPGDIFIMDLGKGLGHTGIIESIDGSILHTIEGNSNNNGSREGIGVVRHTRNIGKPIIGYLRF